MLMQTSEIMTRGVETVAPDASLQQAAVAEIFEPSRLRK